MHSQSRRSWFPNTSMHSSLMAPQLSQSSASDETKPSLSGPLKKFYLGEPLALGITQILIGITVVAFGIVLDISHGWYLISGALSVAAAKNPRIPLVKGMLGMNVVSAVAASVGIIALIFTVMHFQPKWYSSDPCTPGLDEILCIERHQAINNTAYGVTAILLAFNVIEFCITISSSAFGCETLCRDNYPDTIVVVYQHVTSDKTVTQVAPEDPCSSLSLTLPSLTGDPTA
uniref:Membrane-spanning 4-domains subfamily A member 4A-like isoform X3 n=1 Tax=Pogona vitticeps TaxID=103695 RepID=A0ABM5ESU0_9SAUR